MSSRSGAKPITECPVCNRPMRMGERMRVTFSWENADLEKRTWDFDGQKWNTESKKGWKSVTRLMCRDCAESAAFGFGIERPEEAM